MSEELYGRFEKRTELKGVDKAAILFGELGRSGTDKMLKYFSRGELKKIRKALSRIGGYVNVSRENRVLEEAMNFGIRNRITEMDSQKLSSEYYVPILQNEQRQQFLNEISHNADSVANILKLWMDEEK